MRPPNTRLPLGEKTVLKNYPSEWFAAVVIPTDAEMLLLIGKWLSNSKWLKNSILEIKVLIRVRKKRVDTSTHNITLIHAQELRYNTTHFSFFL